VRTVSIFFFLFASLTFFACSSKTNNESDSSGKESNIENPATTEDSIVPDADSRELKNSKNDSLNDATRLSDGKDSVKGEVTPSRIKEIY